MIWQPTQIPPPLRAHEVHIWRVSLDVSPAVQSRYFALLNDAEQQRALRFYRSIDQMHFTMARGCLRILLGHYCQCRAQAVALQYQQQGKPYVPKGHIQFNLSHAYGHALLAFSRDRVLGVDLEYEGRDVEWESLSHRFFAQQEHLAIMAESTDAEQKRAFFRCWTRKEAYVKAHGDGLMRNLQEFRVSVGEEAVLLADEEDPIHLSQWKLYAIDMSDIPYQAALVVQVAEPSPTFQHLAFQIEHNRPMG